MNNLGYVIIEFSQEKEAKGCLLDINLRSTQHIADLLLDKTHLCSDPFYFYQKLRRVSQKIDQQDAKQWAKRKRENEAEMDNIIEVEDVFDRETLIHMGGDYLKEQQAQILEAYLEEKEFNDGNKFTSVLEKYVQKYDRVGRQKLTIEE